MKDWDTGDVVVLRSGGPPMTVEGEDEDGEIQCVWFVGEKTKRDAFPADALEKADTKGG